MKTYFFIGQVLPQRAQISVDFGVSASAGTANREIIIKTSIVLNQVMISVETEEDWNYFDLRNIVHNVVRSELNVLGYLLGHSYELVLDRVFDSKFEIDWVFGIDVSCIRERNKDLDLDAKISAIRPKMAGKNGLLLRICFDDLSRAMKHAEDTAFYCYRAIESLMNHHCATNALDESNNAKCWESFRAFSNVDKDEIMKIKKFADDVRHGRPSNLTDSQRADIFLGTWNIVDKYLDSL